MRTAKYNLDTTALAVPHAWADVRADLTRDNIGLDELGEVFQIAWDLGAITGNMFQPRIEGHDDANEGPTWTITTTVGDGTPIRFHVSTFLTWKVLPEGAQGPALAVAIAKAVTGWLNGELQAVDLYVAASHR